MNGDEERLQQLVVRGLEDQPFCEIHERKEGNKRKYLLGATATIKVSDRLVFLLAFAKTDMHTHKAHASVGDMWVSLQGLWQKVRNEANGERVAVPLVGAGLSGVPLRPQVLLQMILSSIESYRERITGEIDIVLHESLFDEINLEALKEDWR